MALSALLPIGGAALGALAQGAADALRGGISFAEELLSPAEANEASIAGAASPPATSAALDELESLLKQRLSGLRFDPSTPLRLADDGFGNVSAGDHPQRAEIEALFQQDAELRRLFFAARDAAASVNEAGFQAINAGGHGLDGALDISLVLESGRLRTERL